MFNRKAAVFAARHLENLCHDRLGNFGMVTALLAPVLLVAAGGAVDIAAAMAEKTRLQGKLDGAMLAAVQESGDDKRMTLASSFMSNLPDEIQLDEDTISQRSLTIASNSDGSLSGTYKAPVKTSFLGIIGISSLPITVVSTAIASEGSGSGDGCIYALGNSSQAVLINSGANVKSTACKVNVHSTSSPAFIMNSGSTIDTAEFCVKGTNYIKNGGTLTNLKVGCNAADDPYAGKLPEPAVSSTCTTQGTMDGQTISLNPGVHCATTFNGSPTITFKPGLHIIKGRMIINSGATVKAEGVTFYFPDVNSEIRANGGLTFTASAPTSGTYAGILMFEKTSDASNNASKQQYIFNGSKGETLTGIIHLPNRDVTYNSTTNQTSKISLVVNTMIMNSANWKIEPYDGEGPTSGTSTAVRLVN